MYNEKEKCPEVECNNKCAIWAHIAHLLTVHYDRSRHTLCDKFPYHGDTNWLFPGGLFEYISACAVGIPGHIFTLQNY